MSHKPNETVMKGKVYLKGSASTCAVMDWIEQHDCPELDAVRFVFEDKKLFYGTPYQSEIIVSSSKFGPLDIPFFLEVNPLDTWNHVSKNQWRIQDCPGMWICKINDSFYWMTD